MSILCHSPSSRGAFVLTFNSRVPDPKSIRSLGIPRSSSTDIKSKTDLSIIKMFYDNILTT